MTKFQGLVFKAIKVRPPTGDFDPRALSFNQPNQDDYHAHFSFLYHVDGCHSSQECLPNFTGSGFLIPSMLRIAKNYSYSCSCHVFPPTVKQSGLMLLLLMCGDVAMNPGPVMLGSVNARSIQNKGRLLSDTIASHAFDFHIRTTDSYNFLHSLTSDGFSLIHRPRSTGIRGGVGFFICESYKYRKVDTPNYSSFENILISISGRTLLLASIYCPPGPVLPFF